MNTRQLRRCNTANRAHFRELVRLVFLWNILMLSTLARGGTFSDSLGDGLAPEYWTLSVTTPGLYSFDDTQGSFFLAKTAL